jgi:hypothetical protein
VVLGRPALLDRVALPRNARVKVRARVLPPPDVSALPVAAENNIQVAVTVDVPHRAPGFDRQEFRLDD